MIGGVCPGNRCRKSLCLLPCLLSALRWIVVRHFTWHRFRWLVSALVLLNLPAISDTFDHEIFLRRLDTSFLHSSTMVRVLSLQPTSTCSCWFNYFTVNQDGMWCSSKIRPRSDSLSHLRWWPPAGHWETRSSPTCIYAEDSQSLFISWY